MFDKILIANRGESACRVAACCRALGIAAATIHSSVEQNAMHVRAIGESVEVGGPAPADSYLDIDAVIAAARTVGARAIHPGIGFLAEDPAFARAVEAAGLIFIGPRVETLERFADKISAKEAARAAGIPVIEGSAEASSDPDAVLAMASALEPPLLLKAASGGGGRGVRVVESHDGLAEIIASAMREADSAFGRADLLVETYLDRARHIEVQIAGDGEGGAIHLYERECSIQRRHQKIVEEAPAPALDDKTRAAILAAARDLASRESYRGLGTVEFMVRDGEHWFLEVNPRLQVEHPVTEMVTGLDLVELQLRIAAGQGLALEQKQVSLRGHAIEARIYAEDTAGGFVPSTGIARRVEFPSHGVRVDAGIESGDAVTPHYDPLIAKLIAHGDDRDEALDALRGALGEVSVLGVETNVAFLIALLAHPSVVAGDLDTGLIDREVDTLTVAGAAPPAWVFALAGCLMLRARRDGPVSDPWTTAAIFTGWRLGRGEKRPTRAPAFVVRIGERDREVAFSPIDRDGHLVVKVDDDTLSLRAEAAGEGVFNVSVGNRVMMVRAVLDDATLYLDGPMGPVTATVSPYVADAGADRSTSEGRLLAPVMGQIKKIHVTVGDRVRAGDTLVVQESMKMELQLAAPCDGVVVELACSEGDVIARHSIVAEVRPEDAAPPPA